MSFIKIKKEDSDIAIKLTNGTSRQGYLRGYKYQDLVRAFGEPTFSDPSGDNKVQKEWVFVNKNKEAFTLYDWKTYDLSFTENEIDVWNIGHKSSTTSGYDFIDWLESKLAKK
jgi:hypothetical protein